MANSNSTRTQPILQLSGYQILEQIYQGTKTIVYRAVQIETQRPVVIKLLAQDYPSFSELVQFRNQYTVTKNLPIAGIVQPLSLESVGNSYALVMEDFGSISLGKYLQQQPLSLTETLVIAIQIAEILHHLHQHRVIHKDIKPANILIHPDSKQVQLIDFSIASLLPKETQTIQNPNVLEGTLAYLAPEQTGRMNRGVDYRADFYALGITLYQLLTRQLPFISKDPLELIHCHIAQVPISVNQVNPDVPPMVAAIVAKLMAKNAEDRYQSTIGLKYDLEHCLSQYKETGTIAEFKLGQRDLSDRFIIPEKLYGRETEVQVLLDAFERVAVGTTELMLVAGFSGIGKTAVINEVHKPIVRQRGYFIKGKFDQFNRNIPLGAFMQAFRDLVGQLLSESDAQLQTWKTRILQALGDNAQVIIELIPELEHIIGTQLPAPELSGTAAQNRFNLLFQKFIQVFTQPEHPLVMFVDDLQWADSASLNLIQVLMSESQTGCLLMLGAYRDNEVFAAHPLILTLNGIEKAGVKIHTITLQPLSFNSLNHLIADTLYAPASLVQPLTELVMQKTQGNPFFATQFLKALHQDQLITFDSNAGYWQFNIVQVRDAALTDDVVELMVQQLQKLPETTQEILKLAACIGAQFDLNTLAIVSQQSQTEVAATLWKALQEGLVLPQSDIYKFYLGENEVNQHTPQETLNYRFLHDRVQQAAYSLISDEQKTSTHLHIGQLLLQNSSETVKQEKLFDIVEHLNLGQCLISQPSDREELAQLNLQAGVKARNSTAYPAARTYLQTGITLLESNCWQHQYELTLNLYITFTEVSYLNGDFEGMEQQAALVLQQAQTVLDRVKIYEIQIAANTLQSHVLEAIAVGRTALSLLGIELPEEANDTKIATALQTLSTQLANIPVETLVDLPVTNDSVTQAAMRIMGILFPPMIQGMPSLLPLLSSKMVSLSLQSGNTVSSTIGYAIHGLVMSAFLADAATGYDFGKVALNLLEKYNTPEIKPIVMFLFGSFIQLHKEPLQNSIPTLKTAFDVGMETGNFMYAGFSLAIHSNCRFFSGEELSGFVQDMAHYSLALAQVKQYAAQAYIDLGKQTAENFIEIVTQPHCLTGNSYNETVMLPKHQQDGDGTAIAEVYIYKLLLAYYFGNYQDAIHYEAQAQSYIAALSGTFFVPIFYFYAALTHLTRLPVQSEQDQDEILAMAQTHQTTLAQFAHQAPMNHQHKVDLIEAEKQRVWGENYLAADLYDRAIAGAKANGFIQEEALANELAAKFYLNWEKEKVAAGYMQEAYYCYTHWGAKAKVANLETSYPNLLRPILQQTQASTSILSTLATISPLTVSSHTSDRKSSSSTNINQSVDFATILKASQGLSSTIQLDELLHQLTQIILQNSGADRCALMLLSETGEWQVRAMATPHETQLCAEPLTNNPYVPIKLIYYVKNTQEVVVIDNMETSLPVIGEYLRQHQPQSLLCLPLLHQGHLIGILYLNNQLTSGVFTEERILILNFLCTQAAISLENARLYQQLEHSLQDAQQKSQDLAEVLALSNGQQQILALIAQGVSLNTILEATARYIESHVHHPAYCSVLLIDTEGRLCYGAAPSLPAGYNAIVDGAKIGPEVGSCGTAAYCKASVTVTDIATDPLWANYQFALDFGLRACASTPILGAEGQVLATLAMYQPVAGEFTLHDRQLMEVATYLARIAIERHQADVELQNTQLQVLQSEKMASLGNLVAGVAHEINNPIGFLNGSISNGQDYVQDLLGHLALYQQEYPEPNKVIQNNADKIDLEFLAEDLPKLLHSMKGATNRITNISTSLRTFSRADTEYKISANLHEGLDSTLLILKYRLKANEHRPEIQVIQEFDDLPTIECFPGQLNQVFMNLLANAIDMFDEMAQTQSFKELEANPQIITIHTEVRSKQVYIGIRDNGKGMTQEVQEKIFEHLFTTKAVGKGTGLGLAIARQIVVEKHGGRLEVQSQLGQGSEFCIYLPIGEEC
ncbi:AAA family ATPase [Aulosira sp. FACHB-615]|uniref:AAA family ATPase n=1 Tax=Aulosira sp. FACHB-615 TaxID=2692777 RepID=UPI001685D657|nr:AAA family ATPase [Aulosira sp. FACHB-615]MBD2487929.1 AAA family ATPase [Aulosira sp. FACHB-615]